MKKTALTLMVLGLIPATGFSLNLKKIWNDTKSAATGAANVLTAPTRAQIEAVKGAANAVTGNGTVDAIAKGAAKPLADAPKEAGQSIKSAASAVNAINNIPLDATSSLGRAVGGKAGEAVADAATLDRRLASSATTSAAVVVGNTLEGKNPLQVINPLGVSLATALQAAYDQHSPNARPIPDEVKVKLRRLVPGEVLSKARYVVGDPKIALPDGIFLFRNEAQYAVTIDNIIIFKSLPKSLGHWAHELQHVAQYSQYGGIAGFANEYVIHWRQLEAQGVARGEEAERSRQL